MDHWKEEFVLPRVSDILLGGGGLEIKYRVIQEEGKTLGGDSIGHF